MKIKRDCMSDRIKKLILDRICDGTYLPGDRIIELQIAREMSTSQAPVREALCELEAMRVLETQPYKGTRVREVSRQEIEESLQIRAVLENLAAEQVGDRLLGQIDLLRQRARETVEAAKNRDFRQYSLSNLAFHRMIIEASGNQTLILVWESLAPEVRMLANAREHIDCLSDCANDHLEIVDAFAEGDNRFAGKLLRKHAEAIIVQEGLQRQHA